MGVTPYRTAWVGWALEVFALLVALVGLIAGPYRNWKAAVMACVAIPTAILVPICDL